MAWMVIASKDAISKALNEIRAVLRRYLSVSSGLVFDRAGPKVHTQLQLLFNLKFQEPLARQIYEVMLNHGLASERVSPGSLSMMLGFVAFPESFTTEVPSYSRAATVDDIEAVASSFNEDPLSKSLCREAVLLAGLRGRIIVEKTSSSVPSVELVNGYTFELKPLILLDLCFSRPKMVCIDGHIESVSEVHHLLEASADTKDPLVMFVRGASEDVKQTLRTNYDRGSLRVTAISVPFDLEGMNSLVDLSIVCGCDLVSSLKGDLISSIKYTELPTVEQFTSFRDKVFVFSTKTRRAVKGHVDTLRRRRELQSVDDVGHLLDKRIRSLTPNHVIVRLPDDREFVKRSQAIDYSLRAIRSAIDHGLSVNGTLAATNAAARHHFIVCERTLAELGCVILNA